MVILFQSLSWKWRLLQHWHHLWKTIMMRSDDSHKSYLGVNSIVTGLLLWWVAVVVIFWIVIHVWRSIWKGSMRVKNFLFTALYLIELRSATYPCSKTLHSIIFIVSCKEILNVNNASHCWDGLPKLLMHYSWPRWLECGKAVVWVLLVGW